MKEALVTKKSLSECVRMCFVTGSEVCQNLFGTSLELFRGTCLELCRNLFGIFIGACFEFRNLCVTESVLAWHLFFARFFKLI